MNAGTMEMSESRESAGVDSLKESDANEALLDNDVISFLARRSPSGDPPEVSGYLQLRYIRTFKRQRRNPWYIIFFFVKKV